MAPSQSTANRAVSGQTYRWTPQPEAGRLVGELFNRLVKGCEPARLLGERLRNETGTRFIDWVDHIVVKADGALEKRLAATGFEATAADERTLWEHPHAMFPAIYLDDVATDRLGVRVESIDDFLGANQLDSFLHVDGEVGGPMAKAKIYACPSAELWVVERHGYRGLDAPPAGERQIAAARTHLAAFEQRKRDFAHASEGFAHASELVESAAGELGIDWACDLFFRAERTYWQDRNRVAQAQRARQDALGLGWANHDHHTYRSSREHFTALIAVLEQLGFTCRERFYAGQTAGWGAQVLEQSTCGVVIFADVDLAPNDVLEDFAHQSLPPLDRLGTVGLWCQLHGEAFLEAGMHHLECQFDFDEARRQLGAVGFPSMAPFTDFPHLKQAFTEGDRWPVDPARVQSLLGRRLIDRDQAQEFLARGALGSHLEILERNDGYKGFNQTGIDSIITATDPRRAPSHGQGLDGG